MRKFLFVIPFVLGECCLANSAAADDWIAQKLRGEALVWVNNSWVALKRGDVVNTSAVVRTMGNGQVEFVRDHETIDLGPNTQIQIFDRTGQRFTTVSEAFGSVRIEANVENVQHFSVQTPFLAATVKGTIFTVASGAKASEVQVQRGKVGVDDTLHGLHVDVLPGQKATSGPAKALHIAGAGKLAPVVNARGKPLVDPNTPAPTTTPDSDPTAASPTPAPDNANEGNGDGNGDGNGKAKGNGNKKASFNAITKPYSELILNI